MSRLIAPQLLDEVLILTFYLTAEDHEVLAEGAEEN